jgi:type VII secretion integral membrane protein EccD
MATRFTRVTVAADGRSLDVSLPASRPIAELLPQICDLLSLAPQAAGAWAVSTVAAGPIDLRRSLDEAGVTDAQVLYLTAPPAAPAPPVVDDVIDEVQSLLDEDGTEWAGDRRMYGCCALAGIVLLLLTFAVSTMPLAPAGAVVVLADLGVAAAIAGRLLRERGGVFLLAAAVPAWTLAGFGAARLAGWDRASWLTAGLTGAGVGCAALGLTGERWQRVVASAGAAVAFLGLLVTMLVAAGLDRPRVAAVTAVLVVFAVGLAPQLALGRSELVGLMRSQEAGEQISQRRVGAAVTRGQAALTGVLFGIATFAAIAATVLLTSRTWSGVTLGGALGAVFALRSRAFTRAGHVVPMLVPAVVAASVAVIALPRSLGLAAIPATWLAYGGMLAIAVGLVLAGRRRLDEVAAARMRQVFDIIEVVTMLSLVPLVIAVFGGFEWAVR